MSEGDDASMQSGTNRDRTLEISAKCHYHSVLNRAGTPVCIWYNRIIK